MFLKKEKGYIQKQLIPNSIDSFHARSHHDWFCTNSMFTNGWEGWGGVKAKPFSRNTNAIEASVTLAQNKVCSRTFFLNCVEFLVSSAGKPSPYTGEENKENYQVEEVFLILSLNSQKQY